MQKLHDHIPVIEKLRDIGGTAGIAIGVSIDGEAPFTYNLGHRDVENNLPPSLPPSTLWDLLLKLLRRPSVQSWLL